MAKKRKAAKEESKEDKEAKGRKAPSLVLFKKKLRPPLWRRSFFLAKERTRDGIMRRDAGPLEFLF
jgi:hypothetical protein